MGYKKGNVYYGCFGTGTVVAMLTSWLHFHSIAWLIPPGMFGWFYVIYHLIRYGYLQK